MNWILKNPLRFYLLVLLIFIPLILFLDYYYLENWGDVLVEAHGLLFDVILFGILLTLYDSAKKRIEQNELKEKERNLKTSRFLEEIDDFRVWGSKEGMLRIAGSIKRLNKLGITKINLFDCKLKEINLKGANLEGSHFGGADLGNGYLRGVNFKNCNLIGTYLADANLRGANIEEADLERAKCQRSNFQGVNFKNSNCTKAEFWDANLQNADFRNCDLKDSKFGGAILSSARFYGAKNLKLEQLLTAKSLKSINIEQHFIDAIKETKPELLEI